MPVTRSAIGFSGATYQKHEAVRGIIRQHLKMSKGPLKRDYTSGYLYIDCTAGQGTYSEITDADEMRQIDTAPTIFAKHSECYPHPCHGVLYEKNEDSARLLAAHLSGYAHIDVYNRDFRDGLPLVINSLPRNKKTVGLLYYDPNGGKEYLPDLQLLADLFADRRTSMIDMLLNVAANTVKRLRLADHVDFGANLSRLVLQLPKTHLIIRKPLTAYQWSLIVATNWGNYPAWQSAGFCSVLEPEGREYLETLCFTEAERQNGQCLGFK